MKKLITLLSAILVALSLSAQKVHTHHSFIDKAFQKKELPDFLSGQKYYRYLPQQQRSSSVIQFKNSNAVKQQLDMVIAADQFKDEFRYDSKGKLIENISYEWYANQWERMSKSEYIYDNNGNNTQYTSFEWDEDQWLNDYRYEDAFDSDGNNTLSISYIWDGTEWVNAYSKDEYSYDDRGNRIQDLRYSWDGAQWVNSYQTEFTFGSNEELLTIVYSGWDGNDWSNPEKFENIYDSSGNIIQTTISYLDEEQWIVDQSINYEFDSMGNRILLDVYYSDISIYREESVYDEQGNRVEYSIYELSWDSGLMENIMKIETSYDNSFAFEDLILPFMSENEEEDYDDYYDYDDEELDLKTLFNHKLLRMVSYAGDGDKWLMESDFTLVYSEQNITSISQENSGNKMSVFPNPTSSQATFLLEGAVDRFQVEIFDIQGKMVISQLAENNTPISLESLNDGVYFYRLQSKGKIFNGKLVVQ